MFFQQVCKARPPLKRKLPEIEGPSQNKLYIDHDHAYYLKESPRKMKNTLLRSIELNKQQVNLVKKKLKIAQQKARRYKVRVNSLEAVVNRLKQEQLISSSCEEILNNTISGVPKEIMKRMTSGNSRKGCKYDPELMAFALTLHFYSAKTYEFVRKTFHLSLPHQSVVRKQYSRIPAGPGFTEPAFVELKKKAEEAEKEGKNIVCSLMIDEMAIKKHVFWDGKRFCGYVDLGNDDDDSLPVAREALVFMVVCVNSSWKVPCAYFFIDGLGGSERANLVKICIERLSDAGIKVISLTCDGPSCHFSMMSHLGASLKIPNLKPYFPHPKADNEHDKVYTLLDVCHMLKLIRNCLSACGILLDNENKEIRWKYLEDLQELQESEGLLLANKLKKAHIHWWQQKMKVNLAAQAFSSSVADALEFCCKELNLTKFHGCEPTVRFIRIFDHLFDILNSRNPCAKGYKAALRVSNKHVWAAFLDDAYEYILGLKNSAKEEICKTKRKTGFIGFLVAIKSFKGIFHDFVEVSEAPLKYVLTYKFSQDHLELFFGAVRAAGRCNNNPTALQFTAAYKRLLLRSSIQGGIGNVQKRDQTDILHMISDTCSVNGKQITTSDAALIRYDLTERTLSEKNDYADAPQMTPLSEYKNASISYIAGYVAKMAENRLLCIDCCKSLGSRKHSHESAFLKFKDRGGLFKPTKSVIKVCEESEKSIQKMLNVTNGKLPLSTGIPDAIAISVLSALGSSNIFSELNSHMLEAPIYEENHVFALIKTIAKCYCKTRFYHLGKEEAAKLTGQKIRKKLSKLILFENQ